MANVINIADRRKAPSEKPTIEELAEACVDEISTNWERFARSNRLNDYFMNSVPTWTVPGVDYLTDLNALSLIETKVGLSLELASPGSAGEAQLGWIAAFKLNGTRVMTPFMLSEAYARCFNILMFLKLGRELTQQGIHIE